MTVLTPANALPGIADPQHGSGQTKVTAYRYPGAVQPLSTTPTVLTSGGALPGIAFPNHLAGQAHPQNYLFAGALLPKLVAAVSGAPYRYGGLLLDYFFNPTTNLQASLRTTVVAPLLPAPRLNLSAVDIVGLDAKAAAHGSAVLSGRSASTLTAFGQAKGIVAIAARLGAALDAAAAVPKLALAITGRLAARATGLPLPHGAVALTLGGVLAGVAGASQLYRARLGAVVVLVTTGSLAGRVRLAMTATGRGAAWLTSPLPVLIARLPAAAMIGTMLRAAAPRGTVALMARDLVAQTGKNLAALFGRLTGSGALASKTYAAPSGKVAIAGSTGLAALSRAVPIGTVALALRGTLAGAAAALQRHSVRLGGTALARATGTILGRALVAITAAGHGRVLLKSALPVMLARLPAAALIAATMSAAPRGAVALFGAGRTALLAALVPSGITPLTVLIGKTLAAVRGTGTASVFSLLTAATGKGLVVLRGSASPSGTVAIKGFASLAQRASAATRHAAALVGAVAASIMARSSVTGHVAVTGSARLAQFGHASPSGVVALAARLASELRATTMATLAARLRGFLGSTTITTAAVRCAVALDGALTLAVRGTTNLTTLLPTLAIVSRSVTAWFGSAIASIKQIILGSSPRYVTMPPLRVTVTTGSQPTLQGYNPAMPYGNDFSPIDASVEKITLTFDFAPWLIGGAYIESATVTVATTSSSMTIDPTPVSRLYGSPQLAASPSTGAPTAAVLQQVFNCLAGCVYLIQANITTSDNQDLNLASHLTCVAVE
jgi:hypothetical protein